MGIVNYKPKSGWCDNSKVSRVDAKKDKKIKGKVSIDIIKKYIKKHEKSISK